MVVDGALDGDLGVAKGGVPGIVTIEGRLVLLCTAEEFEVCMAEGRAVLSDVFEARLDAMLPCLSLVKNVLRLGEGDELLLSSALDPLLPEPALRVSFNLKGDRLRFCDVPRSFLKPVPSVLDLPTDS